MLGLWVFKEQFCCLQAECESYFLFLWGEVSWITESQNNLGLRGPLEIIWSNPLLKAEWTSKMKQVAETLSSTEYWKSPRREMLQPGQCVPLSFWRIFFIYPTAISLIATCDRCLLPFPCALLCRLPLHSSRLQRGSPSCLQLQQTRVPQLRLAQDVLQLPDHLSGP